MELGVFFFATDYSIDIAELAVELEQRGLSPALPTRDRRLGDAGPSVWQYQRAGPNDGGEGFRYDIGTEVSFVIRPRSRLKCQAV